MSIPITNGTGESSVAAEAVSGLQYQQIEVKGQGGASTLAVNTDGSLNAAIVGTVIVTGSVQGAFAGGTSSVIQQGTWRTSVISSNPSSLLVGASVFGIPNPLVVTGSVQAAITGNQSVITVAQSSIAAAIVSGSIAVTVTPPANQSVSGTVGASIIGTVPVVQSGTNITSLVSTVPSSVIVGASIFGLAPVNITNTNVNVSGSVAAFVQGTPNVNTAGSVVAFQGTSPWIITGSVQGSFSPAANQSVSGTVQAQLQSTNASVITIAQSSIAAAIVSGSVAVSVTPPANQSVSGTVGASIIGTVPVTGTFTIGSASVVQQGTWYTSVQGSITALQGTNPWVITGSVQGSFSPSGNQSVSGTVGASVIGQAPVIIPDTSATGSILSTDSATFFTNGMGTVAFQTKGSWTGTVVVEGTIDGSTWNSDTYVDFTSGLLANQFTANAQGQINTNGLAGVRLRGNTVATSSVVVGWRSSGGTSNVMLDNSLPQGGNTIGNIGAIGSSVLTYVQSSVAVAIVRGSIATVASGNQSVSGTVGASVLGLTPVNITNFGASIYGTVSVMGGPVSVTGTMSVLGTVPVTIVSGSIAAIQSAGNSSTITVSQGSVSAFATITSIATANGGLPIYAPLTSRIQGTADLRVVQGASVAVIGAAGSGIRNYINYVQVANYGSASVLVTIADNTTSILGYTIAPAGGGSNFDTFYRGAANSPITASLNGTASVLVSMQGFTSST